jgi:hypothetical protein
MSSPLLLIAGSFTTPLSYSNGLSFLLQFYSNYLKIYTILHHFITVEDFFVKRYKRLKYSVSWPSITNRMVSPDKHNN